MAKKRKNGEGTWGTKIIKGVKYKYYRDPSGKRRFSRPLAGDLPAARKRGWADPRDRQAQRGRILGPERGVGCRPGGICHVLRQ